MPQTKPVNLNKNNSTSMSKRKKGREINGIVVVNKPIGLSSNQLLQRVKRLFNAQKAGHTGALDPLATGVLPICLGEATKLSDRKSVV